VALLLRRRGIERVRPLDGGLAAWRRLEYPLYVDEKGREGLIPAEAAAEGPL
jgi:3-mercaptopyruvate sulfurtransferase SseA